MGILNLGLNMFHCYIFLRGGCRFICSKVICLVGCGRGIDLRFGLFVESIHGKAMNGALNGLNL